MEFSDNYPKEQLQGLYNMRKQDQLCDVTILVGGKKFRAHKTVLAATGHYFLSMFTSGFKESSAQEITVEGSAAAFDVLLNFVYTGGVKRTKVAFCISEVLEMACYMQFTVFVDTLSAAIQKLLKAKKGSFSLSDVCKVMLLAQTHDLTAVYQATLRYLEDRVESLKCLDMFLENISASFLEDFLCQENLSNADEEKHVLELVINWLKHDWEKRKEYSHQLLQKVRLGLVASEDIKKLIGPEMLDIPGCSELVNRALDLLASNKPKEILAIENPDIAAARSTIMAPVIMKRGEVKYYDKAGHWTAMKNMDPLPSKSKSKAKANNYELIVVKGILYAAGGPNCREFLKYEASANKWVPLPSKPLGKKRIKLVALGAYIYAFGACCEGGSYYSYGDPVVSERYDISAEKWEVLKKVPDKSAFGKSGTLIAEVMETENHKCWHCDDAEGSRKREISAVVFEGKIFVCSLDYQEGDDGDGTHPQLLYSLYGELVIIDPVMNTYQTKGYFGNFDKYEEEKGQWKNISFKSTFFIHEDQLYWMLTEHTKGDSDFQVTTEKLSFTQEDGKITVGYSEDQEMWLGDLLDDKNTPFCIQDILELETGNTVEHGKVVKSFPVYGKNKQLMYVEGSDFVYPVWFSFEKKCTVLNK